MEKAKQAASSFLSQDGKHRTIVDEDHRKAITEEHVRPHRHEEVSTLVDKEIHQHHHHTTVQPINVKETLPEKHTHNMIPVEHKTFNHGDDKQLKVTLEKEFAKYKDSSITHETTNSTSKVPLMSGEHIHHHVHEHVQPILQKETVQPHVIHTTIPIHETHHAAAVHHGTSILPAKTLEEFHAARGTLDGREKVQLSDFEGCPPTYNKDLQREQLDADKHMHSHLHDHHQQQQQQYGMMETSGRDSGYAAGRGEGLSGSRAAGENMMMGSGKADGMMENTNAGGPSTALRGENMNGYNTGKNETLSSSAARGENISGPSSGVQSERYVDSGGMLTGHAIKGTGKSANLATENRGNASKLDSHHSNEKPHKRASLADKLNPFKDADGDGKKGFLD